MSNIGQIALAYSDCWLEGNLEEKLGLRNLKFRSTAWYDPEFCRHIMADMIPEYNNFNAEKVFNELMEFDIKIQIARENSVCVYIAPADNSHTNMPGEPDQLDYLEKNASKLLQADEAWIVDDELRIWWD